MQRKGYTWSAIALLGTGLTLSVPVAAQYPDFDIRGRLHLDYSVTSEDENETFTDGFNNRRARLGGGGALNEDWDGRVEVNVAEGSLSAADFRLRRSLPAGGRLWLGQFKVPQGLNQLTSSNDITFIERSSVSNIIPDSRRIGVAYENTQDVFSFKTMFFQRALGDDRGDGPDDGDYFGDQPTGLAARAVFAPHVGTGRAHFGLSAVGESQDKAHDKSLGDRPELRDGDGGGVRLINTNVPGVEDTLKLGLEAAYIDGPFSVEGEYLQVDIDTEDGSDPTFDGWHVQGSYVLTGESRGYSTGGFGGVTPAGQRGAWELAARYSVMDLDDSGFTGGEQKNLTLGVNYYRTSNLRFMANVVFADVEYANAPDDRPTLFGARAQYSF